MTEQKEIKVKAVLREAGHFLDRTRAAAEAKEFGMALRCIHKAEALIKIVEDYDYKMSGNFEIRKHPAHREYFPLFSRWLALWEKYAGDPITYDRLLNFWKLAY